MMSVELPTSGVNINLKPRELDLVSNALLVRVKTFRASIAKMLLDPDANLHILDECQKDEIDTLVLLRQVATLQGISKEMVEAQLNKNPWMKKDN